MDAQSNKYQRTQFNVGLLENLISYSCCPVCQATRLKPFESITFKGKELRYHRCEDCDLVFMDPMPHQDWYNFFYRTEFWEGKSGKSIHKKVELNIEQWEKELYWADKLISFLTGQEIRLRPGCRMLEIGCGYGLIVNALANFYQGEALGVEPSQGARNFAESYGGVNVVAENMDKLSQLASFPPVDIIIFSHALENIVDLHLVFKTITQCLQPGGYVLIDTPNLFFQKTVSVYHPYCFCRKSLKTLLTNKNFQVVGAQTSGRAKSVFLPRFLTMLARFIPQPNENSAPPSRDTFMFTHRRKAGLFLSRIAKLINPIDRALVKRRYPLSQMSRHRLSFLKKHVVSQGSEV